MDKGITATYRLQINKDFTLFQATEILPYLKALGASHVYLSPIFESTKDSMHGYDICDFTKISTERGGEEAFAALNALCLSEGMHLILDIVPNHMGIAGENPFWLDVLAKGRKSQYWNLFDLRVSENDKIHLPVLGKPLEEAFASGEATIEEHQVYGRVLSLGGRILPLGKKEIEDQAYKPVMWTEAFDKISYRRFFDITDLIGVRVEDRDIYNKSHECLLRLCQKYKAIAGVRVDHIDGLADPTTYLTLLKNDIPTIWVEKILSGDENLPENWPAKGTTGYEFIARLNNLLVNPDGFHLLQKYWYEKIDPKWEDFESCVFESKSDVLASLFPSELKRLVHLSNEYGTAEQAEIFWRGMTVCLAVYRTYAGEAALPEADRTRIADAADIARQKYGKNFANAADIFLPILLDPQTDKQKQIVREWQQLSGPAMAKGLEDCAHYRYTPLAALNEVGCEAAIDKKGKQQYFQWTRVLAKSHPLSLLATSTHDTKRSEDTRARLYTLADRPQEWIAFYEQAVILNAASKKDFHLRPATEYFLYQAIVGVWPWKGHIDDTFIDRIADYMRKSVKEARVETSWLKPDKAYEDTLKKFIRGILKDAAFIRHVDQFVQSIAAAGAVYSLTALTLKILGPAVPDIYQGADGWDFSLVDPDNRRPVIYKNHMVPDEIPHDWQSPLFKIWCTHNLLKIRTHYGQNGHTPEPLPLSGPQSENTIAYKWGPLVVVCPRHAGRLVKSDITLTLDAAIALEAGAYKNLLTDENLVSTGTFPLNSLFLKLPIAVLAGQE